MRQRLREMGGFLIALGISIWFTHLFFSARMLYNNATILHSDYPRFADMAWFLGEFLLPEFHGVFGYSNLLYSGYPMIHVYPIGYIFIIWLISLFGLSYGMAMKVSLFVLMIICGLIPYWAVRKRGGSQIGAIAATLWIWVGMNSIWLALITYGMLPFLLSVILSILFLQFTQNNDFSQPQPVFSSGRGVLAIFLLGIIALVDYMATVFIALIVIIEMLYCILTTRNWVIIRHKINYYAKVVIGALGLISFWLLPTIFIQFQFVYYNSEIYVFSYTNSLISLWEYFEKNYYTILAIAGLNLAYIYHQIVKKQGFSDRWFPMMIFWGLGLALILPFFKFEMFMGINSIRYLCFFEFGGSILVGLFADYTYHLIKKFISEKKRGHSQDANGKQESKVSTRAILCGALLFVLFIDLTPIPVTKMTYQHPLLGKYQNYDRVIFNEEWNYTQWTPEIQELIDWIKANTTKESRILMQQMSEERGLVNRGHTLSYFAEITDRYYANGHLDHFWYKYAFDSTFIDDYLFGFLIWAMDPALLQELFVWYNIEYIIALTDESKIMFDHWTELPFGFIEQVAALTDYKVYRYINSTKNFVISRYLGYPLGNVSEFSMQQSYIHFKLAGYNLNRTVVFSLHDFPNWAVYIQGEEVEKISGPLGLIAFNIPEQYNENILIEIKWKILPIEYIANIISAVTLVNLCIIPYLKKRSMRKQSLGV